MLMAAEGVEGPRYVISVGRAYKKRADRHPTCQSAKVAA